MGFRPGAPVPEFPARVETTSAQAMMSGQIWSSI